MKISNSAKRLLKLWIILSFLTFFLLEIIWDIAIEGSFDLSRDEPGTYLFDFIYCSFYSFLALFFTTLVDNIKFFASYSPINYILHCTCVLLLNVLIVVVLENTLDVIWPTDRDYFWSDMYVFALVATLLTIVFLGISHYGVMIKQNEANKALERHLLNMQLDPHFVFNSLNVLSELIEDRPKVAVAFTLKLSNIHRYVTAHLYDDIEEIGNAVNFTKEYISLLEMRHPNHFKFTFDDKLSTTKGFIISFGLQMMVENAVKHNTHSEECPLELHICEEDGFIVGRNRKNPLKKMLETTRMGLHNLRKRYEMLGYTIYVNDNENFFEVKLPIIEHK